MKSPVVVSFYTPEWEYKSRAKRLMEQCDALGLAHHFQPVSSRGNWNKNTAYKPSFIADMLQQYEHILWLDCDGELFSFPRICAGHLAVEPVLAVPHQTMPRNWHVSALSIRRTPASIALVHLWNTLANEQDMTDEKAFHEATTQMPGLVSALPASYSALPNKGQYPADTVYAVGLSTSPDKMAMKARQAAKESK